MHTNYKCGQKGNTQLPVLIKGRQALPSNEGGDNTHLPHIDKVKGETIYIYPTLIK